MKNNYSFWFNTFSLILFAGVILLVNCTTQQPQNNNLTGANEIDSILANTTKNPALVQKAIDSIASENDSIQLAYQYQAMRKYYKRGDSVSFIHFADLVIQNSLAIEDTIKYAKTLFYQSLFWDERNQIKKAYQKLTDSYQAFQSVGDSSKMALVLNNLAIIEKNSGDFIRSENTALKALSIFKKQQNTRYIASVYNNLALINSHLGYTDRALHFHNQSLIFRKQLPDSLPLELMSINNIAMVYIQTEDFDSAIQSLKNAIAQLSELEQNKQNNLLKAKIIDNLGYALALSQQDLNESKELLHQAKELRKAEQDLPGRIVTNMHLAEFYHITDDTIAMAEHISVAYHLAKQYNNDREILDVLELGLSLSAFNEPEKYIQEQLYLSNQFISKERRYKDYFKSVELEVVEKEAEVVRKEKRLRFFRSLLAVFVLSVILIIGLLIFKHSNKVKQIKQHQKQKLETIVEQKENVEKQLSIRENELIGLTEEQTAYFKTYLQSSYDLTEQQLNLWFTLSEQDLLEKEIAKQQNQSIHTLKKHRKLLYKQLRKYSDKALKSRREVGRLLKEEKASFFGRRS